jgi:hypothetical protein
MPTANLTGILSEAGRIGDRKGGRIGGRVSSVGGRISSVGGRISSVGGRISSVGGRISVGTSVGSTINPANVPTVGSIILCISV